MLSCKSLIEDSESGKRKRQREAPAVWGAPLHRSRRATSIARASVPTPNRGFVALDPLGLRELVLACILDRVFRAVRGVRRSAAGE
jgi:hypothetical protein